MKNNANGQADVNESGGPPFSIERSRECEQKVDNSGAILAFFYLIRRRKKREAKYVYIAYNRLESDDLVGCGPS